MPWNADVALMAVFYIAVGFYYKDVIRKFLYEDNTKLNIFTFLAILILLICFYNNNFDAPKLLDMKQVEYANLFAAYFLPVLFLIIILRAIYFLYNSVVLQKFIKIFIVMGQSTIPILYLHVPLNIFYQQIHYSRIIYIAIGILIPLSLNLFLYRYKKLRKLLGLSKIIID